MMKQARRLFAVMAAVLGFGLLALPAAAQSPVLAGVDRDNVTTGEQVTLSVVVDAAMGQPAEPVLPALDGFQVLNAASGTQVTTTNGHQSVQTVYQYVLQPTRAGRLVIEPITIRVGGQAYRTDPIAVSVSQGTGQPSARGNGSAAAGGLGSMSGGLGSLGPLLDPNMDPFALLDQFGNLSGNAPLAPDPSLSVVEAPKALQGQDYLVDASVDNANPYQGEQVVYTVRFYQGVNSFGQIDYRPPAFTGFWSKQDAEQNQYRTQAGGRDYVVSELRTVLFPTMAGEARIDRARLAVPGGFFGSGAELSSQPVTVKVKPLPAGAPPSFHGAVGQFQIAAAVDKNALKLGDTVTQQVRISGLGNLEALADPQWLESPAWRAFDSKAQTSSTVQDGKLGGTRTYNRTLMPTAAGPAELPAIEFAYFDPSDAAYHTVSTSPLAVTVSSGGAGGSANQGPQNPATSAPSSAPSGAATAASTNSAVAQSRPAIRPIHAVSATRQAGAVPLPQQPVYWFLWTWPLFVLAAQYLLQRRQAALAANPALVRSRLATRQAHDALRAAKKGSAGASPSAEDILTGYLTGKLNRPVIGMTQRELAELLVAEGIDPQLAARTQNCLLASQAVRYAPGETGDARVALLVETEAIVEDLEWQWNGGKS